MFVIPLFMLLVPGLISVRMLWRGKNIGRDEWKFVISDYLIYSFLIMLTVYAIMFFINPERTVSFVPEIWARSHIGSAGFVTKYSFTALVASLVLPGIIPAICKLYFSMEDNRSNRTQSAKKKNK